jgi:hypothetical protein
MMGEVKIVESSTSKSKKTYSSPALMNYGSVADLTLGGTARGSDGGNQNPCNPGADSTRDPDLPACS